MADSKDMAKPESTPIEANERAIMRELVRAGTAGLTRSELADRTGLTSQGVGNIIESSGWKPFLTAGHDPHGGGRRPGRAAAPVALLSDAVVVVGVDLGHHAVKVGLADLEGNWLGRDPDTGEPGPQVTEDIDVDRKPYAAIRWAASEAKRQLDGIEGSPSRVGAVSIGLAAPVDAERGTARSLSGAGEWEGINFLTRFEQHLGWSCPYVISNDAALGARAELHWGSARARPSTNKPGYRHAIYVRWTLGIGGGLIIDGRVYEGARGASGEIGHSPVRPDPDDERWETAWSLKEEHRCSRGCEYACLEGVASTQAILNELHAALDQDPPDSIAAAIACAREEGPRGETCAKAFSRAARYMGQVLGGVANALNPAAVIIGGDFDEDIDLIEDALFEGLASAAFGPIRKDLSVVGGSQREGAVIRGTIARALDDAVVESLVDLVQAEREASRNGGPPPVRSSRAPL
jgi:predicted NBD/HSP70 family sugar kinase